VSEAFRGVVDESVQSTELAPGINGCHMEPRCRVSRNDEVRLKVNDLLAHGSSYAMIVRALGEENATLGGQQITLDSVRNHASRHFPVQNVAKAAYCEIIERRAREAQIDFVNGLATALTPLAFYEMVMNEAFRRLSVDVSVDTSLRAAEKLQALIDARGPRRYRRYEGRHGPHHRGGADLHPCRTVARTAGGRAWRNPCIPADIAGG
jgi:hypothetical protein